VTRTGRGAAHREGVVARPTVEADGVLRHAGAAEVPGHHDGVVAGAGVDDDLLDVDDVELDCAQRVFRRAEIEVDVEIRVTIKRRRDANVVVAAAPRDVERIADGFGALAAIDGIGAIAGRVVDDVVALAGVDGVGAAARVDDVVTPSVVMEFAPELPVTILPAALPVTSTLAPCRGRSRRASRRRRRCRASG
jgi:hypothetical protein